jgi:hypothetical protein
MAEPNHIRDALASVAQDARAAVNRANSEVRGGFSLAGRTGSQTMRKAIEDAGRIQILVRNRMWRARSPEFGFKCLKVL